MSDDLPERKQKHLEICLDQDLDIQSGSTGLQSIALPHRALPETHADQVDLKTEFLGYTQTLPVMISCMTGGSEDGRLLNRLLAEVAGKRKLAIGTGSIRVMLRHPETKSHFDLKPLVPNSPLIANIGAAQLTEYSPNNILEAVNSIDADGLYVHLNPAQELFQEDGDRNFQGWYDGFRRLLDSADIPILVKETGAGIPP
ncbi:MAG: alpha-hydroxy-acid oxidizing protein, partial [Spirochaetaceae bacterium]|nr:alpha-hydroxy-acid oxidizing protein [Spirochaetaceae bacterium]